MYDVMERPERVSRAASLRAPRRAGQRVIPIAGEPEPEPEVSPSEPEVSPTEPDVSPSEPDRARVSPTEPE